MYSDSLSRVKLAINEIARATNEPEIYKCLAEALIKHLGFNRVTVRKVDWKRGTLSLMCQLEFTGESPDFEFPLSEESGVFGKVALRGESIAVFEGEEISPELRLPSKFAGLHNVMRSRSFAIVPIKVKGQVKVVLGVDRKTSGREITPEDKEILDLFSEMAGTTLEKVLVQEELNTALRDELTGLLNRRYFINRLNEEYERAKRYDVPLSCCIFDVDNFKLINDTYGHILGDRVLRQVGKLTAEMVRHVDIAARYGGEEFTILFTHTALEDAAIVAERIRYAISALIIPYSGEQVQVTATFGISTCSSANVKEPEELLYHADMALYKGKKQYGKNCVVISTGDGYRIVRKEEPLTAQDEKREITFAFNSLPKAQEVFKTDDASQFGTFDEEIIERKEPTDSTYLGIIPLFTSNNLRNCYKMAKGRAQYLKGAIRKLDEIKILTRIPIRAEYLKIPSPHLSKRYHLIPLLGLCIILPIIILFNNEKEKKTISPPSSISAPSNGSNQTRLNLGIGIPLFDDKGLEEALKEVTLVRENNESLKEKQTSEVPFKENRVSSKQRTQIVGKSKTRGKKEPLEGRRISSQYALATPTATRRKKHGIYPQSVLAERKKRLEEQLRRAFLLY